jgi:fibronectin-binding autotransporter adhesin
MRRRLIAGAIAGVPPMLVGFSAATSSATDLYWDRNGTTLGAGGTAPFGVWGSTTDAHWNTEADGTGETSTVATSHSDHVFFSAGNDATGSFDVTIGSGSNTKSVGHITLQEGTVQFGNSSGLINIANGGTITNNGLVLDIRAGIAGTNFTFRSTGTRIDLGNSSNTYNGTVSFVGGTVRFVTGNNRLSTTSSALIDGGTLNLNTRTQTLVGFTLRSGTITSGGNADSGTIIVNSPGTGFVMESGITDGGASAVNGLVFAGTTGLKKTTAGTVTYNQKDLHQYIGATSLEQGVLVIKTLKDGGQASGVGASTSDAANLVFNGGTLRFSGAATSTDRNYTLGTNGGSLEASGSGALTVGGNMTTAADSGTQAFTLGGTNVGLNTISGAINDGTGTNKTSLAKTGAGKWVLSGANDYTGDTVINAGTLALVTAGTNNIAGSATINVAGGTFDVSGVTGGGKFTLNSAQTIKGQGTISGSLTAVAGSTVAPGNATGTLTNNGDVTLGAGNFQVAMSKNVLGAGPVPATDYGQLSVAGTGTGSDGTSKVDLTGGNLQVSATSVELGDIYYILSNSGVDAVAGTFAKLNGVTTNLAESAEFVLAGQTYRITYLANWTGTAGTSSFSGGNDVAIMVPEPGSLGLLTAVGAMLLGRRRRHG